MKENTEEPKRLSNWQTQFIFDQIQSVWIVRKKVIQSLAENSTRLFTGEQENDLRTDIRLLILSKHIRYSVTFSLNDVNFTELTRELLKLYDFEIYALRDKLMNEMSSSSNYAEDDDEVNNYSF